MSPDAERWRERARTLSQPGQAALALIVTLSVDDVATIHALTRKVTMTDEELYALALQIHCGMCGSARDEVLPYLLDLRDRYEERGKYAPVSPKRP